ncbi:aldehyde:ferredoxin oxidoreductase [Candidatus Woesearchaeota archaeon]|nr:MAG: aldehyde:ferredoxin oxidoreductase [Candidatus Woesearchaeota archaeon]
MGFLPKGSDPIKRVLYVDLTHKKYWVEDRRDLFEKYIGGTGVAINLLFEEVPKNSDPLGPENAIIFAIGPFTATYPTGSKTVAMFKSPLTGNLGESHAGGRSAVAMRMAGYGAIVIKGKSDIPVWLSIQRDRVYFRDARAIWGMSSSLTVARIIRDNEPASGYRTIMRIGRAGERMVRYAGVITETYRHFGRLGLGAVFGSKKLKAVVISGERSIPVYNKQAYRKVYKEIFDAMVKSPLMKKYHDLGTPINVLRLDKIKALPTMNLKKTSFEYAKYLSGEYLAENFLGRRTSCTHCPVACIHLAALREPYEDEPYFYKTTFVGYDYEPIYSLGTMLGIKEPEGFLKLHDEVDRIGLDAMSAGVVLAWATEALERGIITTKETDGLELKWGDYETYIDALEKIVEQPNEFYSALARGVDYASKVYGGREFALSFGGNEMPGYHTGPAAHISFLIGSRHSHLDAAGYSLDQKTIGKELTPEEIVEKLVTEERWRQILSSLVVCFFARGVYKPDMVIRAFEALGVETTEDELKKLGKEIHLLKYKYKFQEGFDLDNIHIPKRIFETVSPHGLIKEETVVKALKVFKDKITQE